MFRINGIFNNKYHSHLSFLEHLQHCHTASLCILTPYLQKGKMKSFLMFFSEGSFEWKPSPQLVLSPLCPLPRHFQIRKVTGLTQQPHFWKSSLGCLGECSGPGARNPWCELVFCPAFLEPQSLHV